MIFLWILLGVILLLTFVLILRINLIIDYRQGLKIYIRILFFKFDVYKLLEVFRKNGKGDESESASKLAKDLDEKKNDPHKDILGFAEFLIHLTRVISSALKDFFSKAKVDLRELRVSVGAEDAADTALRCSYILQAANGLCAVLQHFSDFRCKSKNLKISPDFISGETKFSLHLIISCSLIHLLGVYLRANIRFFE